MCALCDGQTFTEYVRGIEKSIDSHGWALQYVESAPVTDEFGCDDGGGIDPAFCYTIGLTAFGHPEIVLTSRDPVDSGSALNALARRVAVGRERFEAGMRVHAGGLDFYLVDVDRAGDWLPMASHVYPPGPVRALQAVWRNWYGDLPWEGDASSIIVQPVLGLPPGWNSAGYRTDST